MNYLWDDRFHLFRRDVVEEFPYSDGLEFESRLLKIVAKARDRGTFSPEIAEAITDWPSEYHFSRSRHCLVRPLGIKASDKILELGCGCGAVTRFLGEIGAEVVAVEASLIRARIAAERCRDLNNVRIFVDNLTKFHTDQQFDYVLFIGVLEYAAVFSDHPSPFVSQLHSAAQLLAPGGRVVVAIENQLGLKYLNGCGEDHVGIPFFGVQDLYAENSVRTFGRERLRTQLEAAGLPHVRFYYPFPDYKLPSVILSEEALTDSEFDPVDMLARCHSRDYTGLPFRSFDEALVFSAAHKNGLLAELSNSFLAVAMVEAPPEEQRPHLASAYSANRIAQFATQTTVLRQGSRLKVLKQPLLSTAESRLVSVAEMTFSLGFSETAYAKGRQLLWKLLRARVSSDELEPMLEALRPWFIYVLDQAWVLPEAQPSQLASYMLNGQMLDCTPFNLIESNDELVHIDIEWLTEANIPAGWVITRGLLHSLGAGLASASNVQSLLEIIEALCSGIGLLVTAANVQGWLDQEADFQTVVTGRSPVGIGMYATSGLRSFLGEIASLNQKMRARELEMQEVVAGRDQEIRLKNNFITELEQALRLANDSIDSLTKAEAKLMEELDGAKAQIRLLHVELDHILHSRSWRYTAILRRFTKRVLALGSAGSHTSPQLRRDRKVVADSGFFDSAWYLAHNPDVAKSGVDPLTHFLLYGGAELRDPGPNFCSKWYLDRNPDVQGAGVNPLVHYATFGASEGRKPKPDQRRFDNTNGTPSKEQISSPAFILRAQEEWERSGRDRLDTILTSDELIDIPRVAEPPLSIIMVLCNKAQLSLLSIESILSHADIPFELILVDNASEDNTAQLLERISGATVLSNSTNVGFGPACMQAAALAKGKILCFINNDVLLLPNSLGIVLEHFRSDSNIGAVGGKILLADGSLQEAGSIIWSDGSALGYGRCDDPRLPQYCFRRPVDYCSGAFLFTPTELFHSLGGFSAEFAPAYYEDADYCMAVWQNRLRVIYEPQAVIQHYESASSGGNEAARDRMADQQKKFVEKWRAILSRHHRPQPENILRARVAAHSCNLRIVYIDDRIPHRRLGSGFCRANYIVDQLARMGHCVTCVSLTYPLATNESEYVDVRGDVELFDGFTHRERLLHEYLPNSDIVWISRPHNMQTVLASVEKLAAGRPFPIVYDAEAIFAEREQLKAKIRHEAWGLSDVIDLPNEVDLAKAADAVVVVSPKDQVTMLAAGVADVSVIGHQITPTPTPATFEQRRTVLFVGAMHGSDNPNADSIRYFCRSIWPQVRDATSTILVIVGYGTDTAVGDLSTESVRVLGAKEDLTPFYNDARVFIVPTRYAGGIPYKAHEAAAHGVPMVVSEVIAQQLAWRDEEDYLVARDVRQFGDSCSRLFRDQWLWQKLRSNALERVEAELNEQQFLGTLSTLITKVIGTRKVNPI